jgi:hypothetical protein
MVLVEKKMSIILWIKKTKATPISGSGVAK